VKDKSDFYFTGCGTAFFSSIMGSNILSLMDGDNLHSECVQALELDSYGRSVKNSVTFGVSHSGITKTTLDALHRMKSKGSYTVGITHFDQSPISREVDETLVVGNGPDKSRCHTKCYPASAIPLTMMGIELLDARHAAQNERLQTIRSELTEIPELAKKVLASTESIMKELAEGSGGKRTFYFAGTGPSYANALEAALKILETSYVPAQGFETEQLLHGPWVSIDSESVVFVMATEQRTYGRSMDLVRAATRLGANVVALVHEGDREIGSICKNTIELPSIDEQLTPHLSIIPLYFFAYYMCLRRGYNPDYLRYLTPTYWAARNVIFPPGTH
jgi:glucosamine--fructose-6-phosphate aminotransferase (isomerizing)